MDGAMSRVRKHGFSYYLQGGMAYCIRISTAKIAMRPFSLSTAFACNFHIPSGETSSFALHENNQKCHHQMRFRALLLHRVGTNLENLEYSGIPLNMENLGKNCNKQSIFSSSFKYLCKTAVDWVRRGQSTVVTCCIAGVAVE